MFGSSEHLIAAVVTDGRNLQAIVDDTDEMVHLDQRIGLRSYSCFIYYEVDGFTKCNIISR